MTDRVSSAATQPSKASAKSWRRNTGSRKRRRLTIIAVALVIFGGAIGLILYSIRNNIELFLTPTEVTQRHPLPGARLRIGGLVESGSVVRASGNNNSFSVTDNSHDVKVMFVGLLPDLFREGQGIIAEGAMNAQGVFVADQVLAKHDEKYMPPSVVADLKKQGLWQAGAPKP
ncbi:MAG: cytochrome c maturation protein CcmE [Hyphomicrobiales bacterium]|nr:cytochrome c maturation protein CcmE [Hyphomicrobiales bacterium]MDE2113788.1 cytochrome c maturation protein CcmE [Hyphomicrobiales bacterium]